MIRRFYLGAIMLPFLMAGCSKYAGVEGVVTMDGAPLEEATIMFLPSEASDVKGGPQAATAFSVEEGRFHLETGKHKGMVPGKYKVTVSKRALPPEIPTPKNSVEMMAVNSKKREVVAAKYTQKYSTPIEVEIPKTGRSDLVIAVDGAEK